MCDSKGVGDRPGAVVKKAGAGKVSRQHWQSEKFRHTLVCMPMRHTQTVCCHQETLPEMSRAAAAAVMASGSGWCTPSYDSTHSSICEQHSTGQRSTAQVGTVPRFSAAHNPAHTVSAASKCLLVGWLLTQIRHPPHACVPSPLPFLPAPTWSHCTSQCPMGLST